MTVRAKLPNWVREMIFGKQPEPVPAAHKGEMQESSKRRHELVGEQAELERRLYFLLLESRADAGWYGHNKDSAPPNC